MYASSGNERIMSRVDYRVSELAKCDAVAPGQGYQPGFLSAYPDNT